MDRTKPTRSRAERSRLRYSSAALAASVVCLLFTGYAIVTEEHLITALACTLVVPNVLRFMAVRRWRRIRISTMHGAGLDQIRAAAKTECLRLWGNHFVGNVELKVFCWNTRTTKVPDELTIHSATVMVLGKGHPAEDSH